MDILRNVNVETRIDEPRVDVSRPGRSWRLDDANRIVIGEDAYRRRGSLPRVSGLRIYRDGEVLTESEGSRAYQ